MIAKCKTCGKNFNHDLASFCSTKCFLENIKLHSSSNEAPMENWDSEPWV